ncbi:MAG: enoyl-CoA hydratase/isomerase family protein [Deltaproteobacteria bacterium]|nr:enoyl-CoA hydratase/isomerase family protein [Deltaproteobacteria bacterium]
MSYTTILYDTEVTEHGTIVSITLNRPEVRNAIGAQMIEDLGRALDAIAHDDSVRAVIVSGAGGKAFAAGADIAELKERNRGDALRRINAALFRRLEDQPVPVIAAIQGYALGGGCELAMACDLRIAGQSAKLGQPEVGLGILPGAGAIQRLPRLVGLGRARELIYTGRIIDAVEAERIGLVNRVVPDDQVLNEAKALALSIAKQGALAVRISKLALNAAGRPSPAFETLDVLGQAILFESEEKHARMAAFLEKKR